jgi:radical SAM protein with 4Fe4S-binding SPASM domain
MDILNKTENESFNHPIKTVAFYITKKCSAHCPFCYASASEFDEEFNYNTLIDIIKILRKHNVSDIQFLGGDPCENPHLIELAHFAKQMGMTTTVISNTHKYSVSIKKIVSAIDCFVATFHGDSSKIHDEITGIQGSFTSLVNNLKKMRPYAKSMEMYYNVTPNSYKHLENTVKILEENYNLHFDYLSLLRIIPVGRAVCTNKFNIDKSILLSILEQVESIENKWKINIRFEDAMPLCIIPKRFHRFFSGCEWGFSKVSVDGNGNLYRCPTDLSNHIGNILETSLLEVWNNSSTMIRFRNRSHLPLKCMNCELLQQCGGGCPSSSDLHGILRPDSLL